MKQGSFSQPLEGVCEGLEALAGHNMLEAISFKIKISADYDETVGATGSLIQDVAVTIPILIKHSPRWRSYWPNLGGLPVR